MKYGWNFNWLDISRAFITTSTTYTQGQQQGQMLSIVILSRDKQSCNLSQLYHHEIVYRYSAIYILQLLQVPSEHHVIIIPIILAERIYDTLYKVWEQKYHSWYNVCAYSQQQEIFFLLQMI
jgi:hypothetical protein